MRESRAKWTVLYTLGELPDEGFDPGLVGLPPDLGGGTAGPAPVTGTRSYGKDPTGADKLNPTYPQAREAYCAIWQWTSSEPDDYGTGPTFPGYYETQTNECGTVDPPEDR